MEWQLPKRSVLVPFDFTEPSQMALEAARTMVASADDIDVLYVVAPPSSTSPGAIWGDFDEEALQGRARTALEEEMQTRMPGVACHVKLGDPSDAIVSFATDRKSELIVLPSHGRRGFERWLLGSVSERVVRLAPCPVLVLRRPVHDET